MANTTDTGLLYHGSNIEVRNLKILTNGHYKDFGYGFYCTQMQKQAERWALTKKGNHIVNKYMFEEDNKLHILKFSEMTEDWLDFVVECRSGKSHSYDIVEGPMADDTIWDYIEDFVAGRISREAFWVLVKFKYPIHQIVFCAENALSALTFEGSYAL